VEIPGVSNMYFLKAALNTIANIATCGAGCDGFLERIREKMTAMNMDQTLLTGR